MLIYLLRRLLLAASVILVAVSLLFCQVFLVPGDLGENVLTHRSVAQLIARTLPNMLVLALCAIGWAMALGIPLGCWAARCQNSWTDRIIVVLSISVIAQPAFVVAIYALLIFSVTLKWFPAIGAGHCGDVASQLRALVPPPVIALFPPNQMSLRDRMQQPGLTHLLGTDENGRDVFSRLIYGAQISLSVGVSAVIFSVTIGT